VAIDPILNEYRELMLRRDLQGRGIRDAAVLAAMRTVPREAFVPELLRSRSYDDGPLPIGEGQTISQPYIVAYMAEALELTVRDRVLEIGTGSGYGAAILSCIAAEVYTVERLPLLAESARRRLAMLGYTNVTVVEGDGSLGWPAAAPYAAIVVTAAAPDVPPSLCEQLAPGGRLVVPVGSSLAVQELVRLRRKKGGGYLREDLGGVRFVPLIGEEGWAAD